VATSILEPISEVFLYSFTKSFKICGFQFIQITESSDAEEEVTLFSASLVAIASINNNRKN
jgi:hypothetical protein